MKNLIYISCVFFLSCKKPNERACLKTVGDESTLEYAIDSVSKFLISKNIICHVYQDSLKKIILRGGSNLIGHVDIVKNGDEISINNNNKCNFLRDHEKTIIVEIHYPDYHRFYSETEDSLIFKDTIISPYLYVEQVLGGGFVKLHAQTGKLVMIASNGVGRYEVSGYANHADLRVQTNASGNAENLISPSFELYQNSTGNLTVNIDSALVYVDINGTGDVIYTGTPDSVWIQKTGAGEFIKQ